MARKQELSLREKIFDVLNTLPKDISSAKIKDLTDEILQIVLDDYRESLEE